MSKYRVYELAKEFSTTSKLILDILDRNNMTAKNHMASIEEDAYQVLVRTFAPKPDTAEEIRERQRKKAAAVVSTSKIESPKAPPAPPKVFYGGGVQPRNPVKPRTDQEIAPTGQRSIDNRPRPAAPAVHQNPASIAKPPVPGVTKPLPIMPPVTAPLTSQIPVQAAEQKNHYKN